MAYDPNYPPSNAPLQSAPMRTQFQGLKAEVDTKATTSDTSHNIWGQMPNLDPGWEPSDPPTADDLRWLRDRLIEFNNALARA